MVRLGRYARRIQQLEREREERYASQIRDAALARMRHLFDRFTDHELGEILAAEADRSDGYEPDVTDAYLRWRALGGCEVWDQLSRAIRSLEARGDPPFEDLDWLANLGIEGERGRVAMSYLKRREERLAARVAERF